MQRKKVSCHTGFDFIEDLYRDVEGDFSQPNKSRTSIDRCPHLKIDIFGIQIDALIDTGSQVTCVSENLYMKIKDKTVINELPVNNVQVVSAITKKGTAVRRQILLEMNVGNVRLKYVFLVIPFLTNEVILGNNWLRDQGAVIDYNQSTIHLGDRSLSSGTVTFGRAVSGGDFTSFR